MEQMDHYIDISPSMRRKHLLLGTAGAATSLFLCIVVLGSALWVYAHKSARHQLNRVSFKLLLWAMGAQVVYDLTYIVLYAPTGLIDTNRPGCGAGVLFRLAAIGIVNYLCTCIAINLMLTITFGINPVERKLLRSYVGLSIFLGVVIPTVPACMHHFGWDPIFEYCYFTGSARNTRVQHLIFDLYLWQALSCLIATVAVVITLATLFKHSRTNNIGEELDNLNKSMHRGSVVTVAGVLPTSSTRRGRVFRRREPTYCPESAPNPTSLTMYQLQDKLLGIALRISLYPISLIIVNTILTVGDLYTAIHGTVHFTDTWRFICFHSFLYGGRGIVFAILCIFVDPCLARGFNAALQERCERKRGSTTEPQQDQTLVPEDAPSEKDTMDCNAVSPTTAMFTLPSYSPTFVPPGQEPLILEDPLELAGSFDSPEPSPMQEKFDPIDPVRSESPPTRQSRLGSNMTMDIRSILNAAPLHMNRNADNRREDSMSMDINTALDSPPVMATKQRNNSMMSMDMDQALSLPNRFLAGSSGSIGTLASGKTVTHPSITSLLTAPESRKDSNESRGSNVSMDLNTALASTPPNRPRHLSSVSMNIDQALATGPSSGRSRAESKASMDFQQALSMGPDRYRSRIDSTLSMDITQALTLPQGVSASGEDIQQRIDYVVRGQNNALSSNGSMISGESSATAYSGGSRRPSLPRVWRGAFDSDPYTSPPASSQGSARTAGRVKREYNTERRRMEWVKGMEKLFEEAEAQL